MRHVPALLESILAQGREHIQERAQWAQERQSWQDERIALCREREALRDGQERLLMTVAVLTLKCAESERRQNEQMGIIGRMTIERQQRKMS